ncbi:electron transfer flavoprotein subunit alpha/FixB family protein [Inmirania thermothiophila]|uniref:Electron transfer flavoprotein subunit alpha n=2 Tax=Inmirania thermothiophila TaxID=1750597 RepID=A0A3N1XVW1_9GAMM|nr:FAD-binding protein [Inmirania thermothiophila]ROR29057.1 electron transfer flavoprotein alpha subunit apoprotein [Inmirania thermothiophila]
MKVLVLGEHDGERLAKATRHAVAAARRLEAGPVEVLIAGGGGSGAVAEEAAGLEGVARVLHAEDACYEGGLAENLALLLARCMRDGGYGHLVAAASTFGKNVLPRVAALLGVGMVSEVQAIEGPDRFVRPIYAGNVLERVRMLDEVKVLTVRATAFDAVASGGEAAPVERIEGAGDAGLSRHVGLERSESERPELTAARVVVSGGRGLGSKENFERLIFGLADRLGAAVGASRAAVDAGFVPNDCQVGQTGKVVAPELYVAVGISGAIQHLAGMKDSKVIVAINKDEEAPIFEVADYGLVADLNEAVPELIEALGKE